LAQTLESTWCPRNRPSHDFDRVLICAGLFVRSLRKALATDPGFKTENLVTMMINPKLLGYDQKAYLALFSRTSAPHRNAARRADGRAHR